VYEYKATPIRVIDGDTAQFDIDLGLNVHKTEILRFAGIDTPELNSSDPEERNRANAAKHHVHAALFSVVGRTFVVQTDKPYSTDKYGRWIGTIIMVDGGSRKVLNAELVSLGLAKSYDGGPRS